MNQFRTTHRCPSSARARAPRRPVHAGRAASVGSRPHPRHHHTGAVAATHASVGTAASVTRPRYSTAQLVHARLAGHVHVGRAASAVQWTLSTSLLGWRHTRTASSRPSPTSSCMPSAQRDLMTSVTAHLRHGAGQLKIMYVGGPNTRADFHIEAGEEVLRNNATFPTLTLCQQLFYQLRGEANVMIMEQGQPRNINIRPGYVRMHPCPACLIDDVNCSCSCSRAASRTHRGATRTPWGWYVGSLTQRANGIIAGHDRWWSASGCLPRSMASGP